ncbi:MAG: NHL repeat-containing protein [Thermomicrobiales bacterium]
MNQPTADRLARALAASPTRRATATALATGLAALPLLGSALLPDAAEAKRQRRQQRDTQAEKKKKKKKKATYCVNGQTTQVSLSKKSKKKLKKRGAVPGACAACPATCPAGHLCCGSACVAGAWANQTVFGSGPASGGSAFSMPYGVRIAPDGRTALVADSTNNRISVWTRPDPASTAWANHTTFGTTGSGTSNLQFPVGVGVSTDALTALVADSNNARIAVWTRPSATSTVWSNHSIIGGVRGSGPLQFNYPADVCLTPDGRTAIIADRNNHRISVWTRASATSSVWQHQYVFGSAGSAPTQLQAPYGVAVTADGLLVAIADSNNHRVSIWTRISATAAFTHQTTFGGGGFGDAPNQFKTPAKIALSSDALTAYVADSYNNRVSIWTRPAAGSIVWTPLTTAGSGPGSGAANLNNPLGVAMAAETQTLLVADSANNRISVWAAACPA